MSRIKLVDMIEFRKVFFGAAALLGILMPLQSSYAVDKQNTFLKDGIFTPGFGELSLSSETLAGYSMRLINLGFGWQLARFEPFSVVFGYGMLGVSKPNGIDSAAPKDFRMHVNGPTLNVFYLPSRYWHLSLGAAFGSGSAHYTKEEYSTTGILLSSEKVDLKASSNDFSLVGGYRVGPLLFVTLGVASRTYEIADDAVLDTTSGNSIAILLGLRGSQL